jgi:ABC-type Mn2+/Zn2+ transport system permease subunit
MSFAVHGTAELAFTGAAAGLLIADNPVAGALVGSLVVAAAQRLSASPLVVTALSVVFAVVAADGGLLASFGAVNIKASVCITSISFVIYLAARLAGPVLRDRRQRHRQAGEAQPADGAYAGYVPGSADTGTASC